MGIEWFNDGLASIALHACRTSNQEDSFIFSPVAFSSMLHTIYQALPDNKFRNDIEKAVTGSTGNVDFINIWTSKLTTILPQSDIKRDRAELRVIAHIWTRNKQVFQSLAGLTKVNEHLEVICLGTASPAVCAKIVNAKLAYETKGIIADTFEPADFRDSFLLVVTGVVYFQSLWKTYFFCGQNRYCSFYGNTETEIVFMQHKKKEFPYYENEDLQVLTLPYEDEEYGFNVFLPKVTENVRKSNTYCKLLDDFVNGLSPQKMEDFLCQTKNTLLNVSFPLFTLKTEFNTDRLFNELGLDELLGDGMPNALKIDKTGQTASILVDEYKTVAAAVQYAKFYSCIGYEEDLTEFVADHPFLYSITKESTCLFVGLFRGL